MHTEARQFCLRTRLRYGNYFHDRRVLDVGSLDINGNNRGLFASCEYLGIDIGAGPNVDKIGHLADLNGQLGKFHVVISTEALEHDRRWRETLGCMTEKLVSAGLLLLTWATPERREHGTIHAEPAASPHTTDYYRGLAVEDVRRGLPIEQFQRTEFSENKLIGDGYFMGILK